MVEPAAGLVAWLLGFQLPHPKSLCGRGWPRAVWKGLIQFYCMARKKLIYLTQQFILVFHHSSNSIVAKMMDLYLPHALPPFAPLIHTTIHHICLFFVDCCVCIIDWQLPKATMYFILIILCGSI